MAFDPPAISKTNRKIFVYCTRCTYSKRREYFGYASGLAALTSSTKKTEQTHDTCFYIILHSVSSESCTDIPRTYPINELSIAGITNLAGYSNYQFAFKYLNLKTANDIKAQTALSGDRHFQLNYPFAFDALYRKSNVESNSANRIVWECVVFELALELFSVSLLHIANFSALELFSVSLLHIANFSIPAVIRLEDILLPVGQWSIRCQQGKLQSPIPLSPSIAVEKEYHQFRAQGYGQTTGAILKNNGHSGRFPLELHLVHYRTTYTNIAEALKERHGVAVFAVLFELSPDDDEEFVPLLNIIETLQTKVNAPRPLRQFTTKNFLPRNIAGFYRYEGSLTTPECNEGYFGLCLLTLYPFLKIRNFELFKYLNN
ncbi:hypothetical protein NQ317_004800 [Molorchus minor]|uniref:Alpha-carbonic anhydrase domain-containing protein n=1 Tax=Molorchus minor TaxID=1323400 RepID=A0ABQ9JT94_9CUCU|nr:hypothetical protein NQ317_004800 [Molorchus minor]